MFSDENGTWRFRFQRLPDYGVVDWDYSLAPNAQSIAAAWVTEDGLRWWRNGVRQPKNAEHFEPPDHLFHGTMKKFWVHDNIDHQDYLTFRHNPGPGGTASVTFAGTSNLVH